MRKTAKEKARERWENEQHRQAGLLEYWAEGAQWGLLYRAALWPHENSNAPPTIDELRSVDSYFYSEVLQTIGTWRRGEVWAIVLWEQSKELGGGIFFSVEPVT